MIKSATSTPTSNTPPRGEMDRPGPPRSDTERSPRSAGPDSGWPVWHVIAAVALAVAGLGVFWIGFKDLAWLAVHDTESSHILLVPPLLIYLLVQRWRSIVRDGPSAGWLGLPFLLAAVGVWEYGYRHDLRVNGHLAVVLLLIGAWITALGWRAAWRGLAILGLVLFLIPIPYSVRIQFAVPAQRITAAVAEQVLLAGGADVSRSGSLLRLGATEVGVAEACNGMRMLFAVVLICYAYAVTTPMRAWARVATMLISPVVALAANVVRVVLTAWVYGWATDGTASLFHDLSGWAIAGLAFGMIWALTSLVGWMGIEVFRDPAKQNRVQRPVPKTRIPQMVPAGLGLVILAGGLGINQTHLSPLDAGDYHARVRAAAAHLPKTLGPYVGTNVDLPPAASELLTPNVLLARRYRDLSEGGVFTFLFVQCFDARDMLGHYPTVCYPGQGWKLTRREDLPDTSVGPVAVFRFSRGVGSSVQELTVAQAFMVPDETLTTDIRAIDRAAGNFRTRHLGAAQWQIIRPGFAEIDVLNGDIDILSDVITRVGAAVREAAISPLPEEVTNGKNQKSAPSEGGLVPVPSSGRED